MPARVPRMSFSQVYGWYGPPLVLITTVSMLWTMWLVFLNMDPNYAANKLARTEIYDGGEFWMIVEPDQTFKTITVGSLVIVVLLYMNVLRMLLLEKRPLLPKPGPTIRSAPSTDFMFGTFVSKAQERRISSMYLAWRHITGYEGKYRRIWNMLLKVGDLIMESVALYRMMENGSPIEIVYCYGILISANSLSSASAILFGKGMSALSEIVLDSLFDMMVAVGLPITSMVFAYYQLILDHGGLQLRMDVFSPAAFERIARLHANPIEVTRFRMSFDAQRTTTFADYLLQVCINIAFSYRLKRLTDVLKRNSPAQLKLVQANRVVKVKVQTRIPKVAAVLFLITSTLAIYIPHYAIEISTAICDPHPQCVMYAYRYKSMESCPCIGLVDVDPAVKSYEEWVNPKDATSIVKELSKSRDLQIVMITNRRLRVLPEELQYCTQIKILYLMYTGVTELPDWFGSLESLEIMQVEGKTMDTNLIKIDEKAMKGKKWLTYLHFGMHAYLPAIPNLEDLTNLRYFVLAYLFNLQQIASFSGLHRLENLIVVNTPRLTSLPDMSSVGDLTMFVVGLNAPLCCNGFMGACNQSHPFCTGESVIGAPPSLCLTENSPLKATPATLTLLNAHSYSICILAQSTDNLVSLPPTKESIETCNGTMYKECQVAVPEGDSSKVYPGICFPSRMRVIFCVVHARLIAFRQQEIKLGIGTPCDQQVEAWLGCK